MDRRQMLAALGASALMDFASQAATTTNTFLELKTWRLHNTREDQAARVADYLETGLAPGLQRAGAKLAGCFSNVIGPDGPYYVTLAQFASLAAIEDALAKLRADEGYQRTLKKMDSSPGLPFVRVESSILRRFDSMPEPLSADTTERRPPRIFELRTYESQSFTALTRKIAMFNGGEIEIFRRLGMRPVFFGETIAGPKQPNLMYMLSYDDLAARDKLWQDFGNDPEWKKLSGRPELKDSEIIANISNVILRPLTFSAIR
ncbi:MAG: NIPSNAP family protein [Bryobacteraceae bacterium]